MTLGYLVEHDVTQNGLRMLVEFLDTNDFLNLSSCCKKMITFRSFTKNVNVNFEDKLTGKRKRQLDVFLSSLNEPKTLFVQDARVYANVTRYMVHQYKNVQAVTFAPVRRMSKTYNVPIFKALSENAFNKVTCLTFYNTDLSLLKINLHQSGCPALRSLVLEKCHFQDPLHTGLLLTFLPSLTKFALRDCSTSETSTVSLISVIAIALKVTESRPKLQALELVKLQTCMWDGIWLSEAFCAKAFDQLQSLKIEECLFQDPTAALFLNSMGEGNCASLRRLYVHNCGCERESASVLTTVIESKALPYLTSIVFVDLNPETSSMLMKAINTTYPHLLWRII
jgi:hypothetical protein